MRRVGGRWVILLILGGDRRHLDRSENGAKEQRRAAHLALQDLLQLANAIGHPLDRRSFEYAAGGRFQCGQGTA